MPHFLHRAAWNSTVIAILAACIGCETASPVAPVVDPAAAPEAASFITVSADAPAVGTVVTVVANADRAGGTSYGSFTAHLSYDAARLEFVDEFALGGGLRALHVTRGTIAVAGASAGSAGFADGRMFGVRFRVLASRPFLAMSLRMDELNGVDFTPQLGRLSSRASIAVDASIK